MITSDLTERAQLLRSDLCRVRWQGQSLGSGATIHAFINKVATAHGALQLVDVRHTDGRGDDIEQLLALAEASLREARSLIAQSYRSSFVRRFPNSAA